MKKFISYQLIFMFLFIFNFHDLWANEIPIEIYNNAKGFVKEAYGFKDSGDLIAAADKYTKALGVLNNIKRKHSDWDMMILVDIETKKCKDSLSQLKKEIETNNFYHVKKIKQETAGKIDTLNDRLEENRMLIARMREEKYEKMALVDDIRHQLQKLQIKLSNIEQEKFYLDEKFKKTSIEFKSTKEKSDFLQTELNDIRNSYDQSRAINVQNLTKIAKLDSYKKDIGVLKNENIHILKKYNNILSEKNKFERRIKRFEQEEKSVKKIIDEKTRLQKITRKLLKEKNDLEKIKALKEKFEKENKYLAQEISKLKNIESKYKDLIKNNDKLKKQLNELINKKSDPQENSLLIELKSKNKKLKNDLDKLNQKSESDILKISGQMIGLKQENALYKNNIRELKKEKQELEKKILKRVSQSKLKQIDNSNQVNSKIKNLQKIIQDKSNLLEKNIQETESLNYQLDKLRQDKGGLVSERHENKKLKIELKQKNIEIDKLNGKLKELNAFLNKEMLNANILDELKYENRRLKNTVNDFKFKFTDLIGLLKQKNETIKTLNESLNSKISGKQLAELQTEKDTLLEQINTLRTENSKFQETIKNMKIEGKELEKDFSSKIEELENDVSKHGLTIVSLNEQLNKKENENENLEKNIDLLKSQYNGLQEKFDLYQKKADERLGQVKETQGLSKENLKKQLLKQQEKVLDYKQQLIEENKKSGFVANEKNNLELKCKFIQGKLDERKRAFEYKKNEFVRKYNAEKEKLKQEILVQKDKIVQFENSLNNKDREIENVSLKLKDFEGKYIVIKEKFDELKRKSDKKIILIKKGKDILKNKLAKKINEQSKIIQGHEKDLEQKDLKIDNINRKVKEIKNNYAGLQKEFDNYKVEIRKDSKKVEKKKDELYKQIKQIKEQNYSLQEKIDNYKTQKNIEIKGVKQDKSSVINKLRKHLMVQNKTIQGYQNDLRNKDLEIESVKKKVKKITLQLNEKSNQISEKLNEIKRIKQEFTVLIDKYQKIKNDYKILKNTLEKKDSLIEEISTRNRQFKQELDTKNKKYDSLLEKVNELKSIAKEKDDYINTQNKESLNNQEKYNEINQKYLNILKNYEKLLQESDRKEQFLVEKNSAIKKLQKEISDLKSFLDTKNGEYDDIQVAYNDVKKIAENRKTTIIILNKKAEQLKIKENEYVLLFEKYSKLTEKRKKIEQDFYAVKKELNFYKEESSKYKKIYENLNLKFISLTQKFNEKEKIEQELLNYKNKFVEKTNELDKIIKDNSVLQQNLEKQNKTNYALKSNLIKLKESLDKNKQNLSLLKQDYSDIKKQYSEKTLTLEKNKKQLTLLKKDISVYKKDFDININVYKKLETKYNTVYLNFKEKEEQLKEKDLILKKLRDDNVKYKSNLAIKVSAYNEMESEYTKIQTVYNDLSNEMKNKNKDIKEKQAELKKTKADILNNKNKYEESIKKKNEIIKTGEEKNILISNQIAQLKLEKNIINSKKQSLQDKVKGLSEYIKQSSYKIKELRLTKKSLEQELSSKEKEIDSLTDLITNFKIKNKGVIEANLRLNNELVSIKEEMQKIAKEKINLIKTNETIKNKSDQDIKYYESVIGELGVEINSKDLIISGLENDIEKTKKNIDQIIENTAFLKDNNNGLQMELAKIKKDIERKLSEISELREVLSIVKVEKNKLQEAYNIILKVNMDFKQELDFLKKSNYKLEDSLKQIRNDNEGLKKNYKVIVIEKDKLFKKNTGYIKKIDKLEQDRASLKIKIKNLNTEVKIINQTHKKKISNNFSLINNLKKLNKQQTNLIEKKQNSIIFLKEDVSKSKVKINTIKHDLSKAIEAKGLLNKALLEKEDILIKTENKNMVYLEKNQGLLDAIKSLNSEIDKIDTANKEKINEFNIKKDKLVKSYENKIKELNLYVDGLGKRHKSEIHILSKNYEGSLRTKEIEFNQIISKNNKLIDDLKDRDAQLQKLYKQISLYKDNIFELKDSNATYIKLNKDLKVKYNNEIEKLGQKNSLLLNEKGKTAKNYESEKDYLRANIGKLESLIDLEKERNKAGLDKIRVLDERLSIMQKQNNEKLDIIEGLKRENSEINMKIGSKEKKFNVKVSEYEFKIKSLISKEKKLIEMLEKDKQESKGFKDKINQFQRDNARMSGEYIRLQNEIKKIKNNSFKKEKILKNMRREKMILEKQKMDLENKISKKDKELTLAYEKGSLKITKLQQKLGGANASLFQKEDILKTLNKDIVNLNEQIEKNKNQNKKTREIFVLQMQNKMYKEIESVETKYKDRMQVLKNKVNIFKEQIKNLSKEKDDVEEAYTKTNFEVLNFQEKISDMKKEKKILEQKLEIKEKGLIEKINQADNRIVNDSILLLLKENERIKDRYDGVVGKLSRQVADYKNRLKSFSKANKEISKINKKVKSLELFNNALKEKNDKYNKKIKEVQQKNNNQKKNIKELAKKLIKLQNKIGENVEKGSKPKVVSLTYLKEIINSGSYEDACDAIIMLGEIGDKRSLKFLENFLSDLKSDDWKKQLAKDAIKRIKKVNS